MGDLQEIVARLSALVTCEPGSAEVSAELTAIRARLRILAEENAEVGKYLATTLGLASQDEIQPNQPSP